MKFISYAIALLCLIGSCESPEPSPAQKIAVKYLVDNSLISDSFDRMLFNTAVDVIAYDPDEDWMYFSFDRSHDRAELALDVAIDTNQIEWAPCTRGPCNFHGITGDYDEILAFRMKTNNLRVDAKTKVKSNMLNAPFSLTLQELIELNDSSIHYDSPKKMDTYEYFGQSALNVGRLVSQKDKDPMIKRIALRETKGIKSKEKQAQKLCDYVSNNITYSYEDYWYNVEIAKRPHEVLLSGMGDCSSKSIVLASLLNQMEIPYVLLYYPGHVNIGISGKFPKDNFLNVEIDSTEYFMAETTVPDFKIGSSFMRYAERLKFVLFYQNLAESMTAYDLESGQKIDFYDDEKGKIPAQ